MVERARCAMGMEGPGMPGVGIEIGDRDVSPLIEKLIVC